MELNSIIGKEQEFLSFMKERGYSVFHLSNMFRRDMQYAVRDYYRATIGKDIGSRKCDEIGNAFIDDLVKRGMFVPFGSNCWTLHNEEFLLKPKTKEEPAAAETTA